MQLRAARAAALTAVTWTPSAATDTNAPAVVVRSGAGEQSRVAGTLRALRAVGGSVQGDRRRPVVVVFPEYPARAALVRASHAPGLPWMVELAAYLRADPLLREAARNATPIGDSLAGDAYLTLARAADGRVIAAAAAAAAASRGAGTAGAGATGATNAPPNAPALAQSSIGNNEASSDTLLVFAQVDAGSVAAAALLDAVSRAVTPLVMLSESDPAVIDSATLRAMERAPSVVAAHFSASASGTGADIGESDARWVWLLVLLLLGAETWLRRPSVNDRQGPGIDVAH